MFSGKFPLGNTMALSKGNIGTTEGKSSAILNMGGDK